MASRSFSILTQLAVFIFSCSVTAVNSQIYSCPDPGVGIGCAEPLQHTIPFYVGDSASDVSSDIPSDVPSDSPSDSPSDVPSDSPSDSPSDAPSFRSPSDASIDIPSDFYTVDSRYGDFGPLFSESTFSPDPHGVAGIDLLVAVISSQMSVRDKFGNIRFIKPLRFFFREGLGIVEFLLGVFHPKVFYDAAEDRFIVLALCVDAGRTESSIFLAVSKDGSPETPSASDWNFGTIDSSINGNWASYPGISICDEAIYITTNMYTGFSNNSTESRLWIISKDSFYSDGSIEQPPGSPFNLVETIPLCPGCVFTSQPAGITGSAGAYLLSFGVNGIYDEATGDAVISVIQVSDPLGEPSLDQQFVDIGQLEAPADICSFLPNAPQPNNPEPVDFVFDIDTNDKRMLEAVWQNDELWSVFTVSLEGKATAYWAKLDTGNSPRIEFLDKGPIDVDSISDGASTFYPSIAVNKEGIVAFGFAASGRELFAGSYVTVRDDANDPMSTVRDSTVAKPGLASYNRLDDLCLRNRWGDYTGMALDPVDDHCFWAYNQYADFPSGWHTAWARLCVND